MKFHHILFWLFPLFAWAQEYLHYDMAKGLPSNRIYKIIQDKEGFIWMATDKGIVRFDGEEFKIYTVNDGLPTNDIWDLVETKDGKVWYLTKAPRMGYIFNGIVYAFPFEGRSDVIYPSYFTDKKKILYRDINTGISYRLKQGIWQRVNKNKNFVPVLNKRIKGFKSLNDVKWIIVSKDDSEFLIKEKISVTHVNQINDSLIYVIYFEYFPSGLRFTSIWFNMNNDTWYEMEYPLTTTQIQRSRAYATNTDVQITSERFWAELNNHFRLVDTLKLKDFPYDWRAFRDKEGNFWVYTYSNGVYFFRNRMLMTRIFFKNEKIRFLKSTPIGIIASVLGKGIYLYDTLQHQFRVFFKTSEYIHDAYIRDKNDFILSGAENTYLVVNGKIKEHRQSPFKIFKDNDKFYLLSHNAIQIRDERFHPIDTIIISSQEAIVRFKQRLISGGSSGLYEITSDSSAVAIFKDNFRLPVLSLETDGNYLYIGTDGYGLYRWDGHHPPELTDNIRAKNINDILFYDGKLWLATATGIKVFRPFGDTLIFRYVLHHYDGLPSNQIIDLEISKQKLFAAAYSGISTIDTSAPHVNTIHKIYLKKLLYNDKPLFHNKIKFNKNGNLYISFGVVDFGGQEHNRYFYRLLPNRKQWQEIPGKTIALSNLSPGEYAFQIKAINPYGQIIYKTFGFEILPLWWQTPWARAGRIVLIIAMLFGTAFFVRYYELRKNQQKMAIRSKLTEMELHALRSQMNPHFIFNALNAIQYYISDENFNKSEEYLIKFARLIRMIFDFSRNKTLSLHDEIKMLRSYLELEKMRFGNKLNISFNIDPQLDLRSVEIPTMLVQPLVENAVNHGIFHKRSPGNIWIDFKKIDDNTLQITVADDGIGIKKAEEIKRNSLRKHLSRASKILADRIKLLNESGKWKVSYQLEDLTGNNNPYATRVTLKIKKL